MQMNDLIEATRLFYKGFVICSPHLLMLTITISSFLVLIIFYGKNSSKSKKHADKFFSSFRIGGHRGSPMVFPENSIAGFVQAKKDGVDLIEFDISLTKDGVALLLHDDDLIRTTNMKGPIRDKRMNDLKGADISAKFIRTIDGDYEKVSSEGLPTLEETVRWSLENNMLMLFDVKDSDRSLVRNISELFDTHNLYERAIVCSFYPTIIYRLKRENPNIVTGLTWRRKFYSYTDNDNKLPRYQGLKQIAYGILDIIHVSALKSVTPWFLGADLLLTNNKDISRTLIEQQRAYGRYVAVWTVNDVNEMKWMMNTLEIPVLTDFSHFTKQVTMSN